jgi:hypothetical protein
VDADVDVDVDDPEGGAQVAHADAHADAHGGGPQVPGGCTQGSGLGGEGSGLKAHGAERTARGAQRMASGAASRPERRGGDPLLALFGGGEAASADELAEATGMVPGELAARLGLLEAEGKLRRLADGRFAAAGCGG